MTVSNFVNGKFHYMGEATRRRVAEAVAALNYRPDTAGRSLRSARQLSVGMIVVDESPLYLSDGSTTQVVSGLGNVRNAEGYTLQPDVIIQFHPGFYAADAEAQAKLKAASLQRLRRTLQTLDEALDPGPYFFADRLTVCDFGLAMQAIWPEIYPGSIDDHRNLKRLVDRVTERPAVQRVLTHHLQDRTEAS